MDNTNCLICSKCPAWKNSLFSELTTDELEELAINKKLLTLKKNDAAFRQGETISGLFCIGLGGMKILQKIGDSETLVRLAPPGDTIGHRSIFIEKSYKGSAIAMNNSTICYISLEIINKLLNSNTSFALKLIKKMAGDMNVAEDLNLAHRQKNVRERFASFLLLFSNNFGSKDDFKTLDLALTRQEIASLIGSAEDTIIRLFSEFKENKWIEENGKSLVILDHNMLKKLSGYPLPT